VTIQKNSFPYSFAVCGHVIAETTNTWRMQIAFCGITTNPRRTIPVRDALMLSRTLSVSRAQPALTTATVRRTRSNLWRRIHACEQQDGLNCSEHTELRGFVNAQYFATAGPLRCFCTSTLKHDSFFML
jgi:hypothetical protein